MKKNLFLFLSAIGSPLLTQAQPYNVLFIAVDDLRPEIGCYGNKIIKTPNIDGLASTGVVFNRAYCQQAICMASRASLMTGIFPEKNGIYKCIPVNQSNPGDVTMNKFFENQGYTTRGFGKIYHFPVDHRNAFSTWIDSPSQPGKKWQGRGYLAKESIALVNNKGFGPAYESPDVDDSDYYDGFTANKACESLITLSKEKRPFFLAVGFHRPHLPFCAPKKYWDLYNEEEIMLADNQYLPENFTEHTIYNFGELRAYDGIPKGKELLPADLQKKLKHGYYASVSYSDALIGKILKTLKDQGLDKNTIVVLWGDHGWKLGEHGMWCKHTNFELDTHVPLIIKAPGQKPERTDNFVELLDLYPTLVDLCGFKIPAQLDGKSLVTIMKNPAKQVSNAAFSIYPHSKEDADKLVMGYSVGTPRYRYIEWVQIKNGKVMGTELYDHSIDPKENKNIASLPGNESVCRDLSKLLHERCDYKTE